MAERFDELKKMMIMNQSFDFDIHYNTADAYLIKNNIEKLSMKFKNMDKIKAAKFDEDNIYFKENLFNFLSKFNKNGDIFKIEDVINIIRTKDEINKVYELNSTRWTYIEDEDFLLNLLRNQKLNIKDIIEFMESNLEVQSPKEINEKTHEILSRLDLDKETLDYFYKKDKEINGHGFKPLEELYETVENLIYKNKKMTLERFKLLDDYFDIKTNLKSYCFKNDDINDKFNPNIFENNKNNSLLNNQELLKFILNEYKDTINDKKLLTSIFHAKNENFMNKEDFKIICEHYNHDFSKFDDILSHHIFIKLMKTIKENGETIKLNDKYFMYDIDDSDDFNDNRIFNILNAIQFIDSPNTIGLIKDILQLDSKHITDFIFENTNEVDDKISRLKTIFQNNKNKYDLSDFDEIIKKNIEEGNNIILNPIHKILNQYEDKQEKSYKLKRKF